MKKFNTTSSTYRISFKDLEVGGLPDISKDIPVLYRRIDLIGQAKGFMENIDTVPKTGLSFYYTLHAGVWAVCAGYQIVAYKIEYV